MANDPLQYLSQEQVDQVCCSAFYSLASATHNLVSSTATGEHHAMGPIISSQVWPTSTHLTATSVSPRFSTKSRSQRFSHGPRSS